MDAKQLIAIKERMEKATPGPWEVCNGTDVFTELGAENKDGVTANHNDGWYVAKANEDTTSVGEEEISLSYTEQNANARFIANARQDIPTLVAEVEKHQNRTVVVNRIVDELRDVIDVKDAEIERLRKALEYYADEKHYEPYAITEVNPCDITEDGGHIASEALK